MINVEYLRLFMDVHPNKLNTLCTTSTIWYKIEKIGEPMETADKTGDDWPCAMHLITL